MPSQRGQLESTYIVMHAWDIFRARKADVQWEIDYIRKMATSFYAQEVRHAW